MMNSTNGFGFNPFTPSFVNGLGGFVPGMTQGFGGGFNGLSNFIPGLSQGFGGGFNGLSNFIPGLSQGFGGGFNGLGWNNPMNAFGGAVPFGSINPSFVGGWNGLSPVGFNGMSIPSLYTTPSINSWNGFNGQSPIGLGWNNQINAFGGSTPSFGGWNTQSTPFGGFLPFVSPINTVPGFVPGYSTPSFNQGFMNTVNPTVNGGTVPGYTNSSINTSNLYGQSSGIASNGYNTPYANTVPYSPFGVQTPATCAHAA
jgi:hypothetical protein